MEKIMNFNEIKLQLFNLGLVLASFWVTKLLLNYLGLIKPEMNWYLLIGLIGGYILGRIIKYIYNNGHCNSLTGLQGRD